MPAVSRLHSGDPNVASYAATRAGMWDVEANENQREVDDILRDPEQWSVFVACDERGSCIGFLEVRLREYAEGASTSPVGYVEGWYVNPKFRNS
jgi:aminoglycoside 6'-N-acetyltransferase I